MKSKILIIDREIGIFNCCFEKEIEDPVPYIKVCRERKLIELSLFIESLKDLEEDFSAQREE
jgi:hypothetical protein